MKKTLTFLFAIIIPINFLAQEEIKTGCISGDCKNGKGTYVLSNGDRYNGNWKEGKFNGNGSYYFSSNETYKGDFKKGLMDGFGTFTFADKSQYDGQWKNGLRHGTGKYIDTSTKTIFFGEYKEGQKNGKGLLYSISFESAELQKRLKRGLWEKDVFIKTIEQIKNPNRVETKIFDNTKSIYVPDCLSGDCKNGYGLLHGDEEVYIGNFINGKLNDNGKTYKLKFSWVD